MIFFACCLAVFLTGALAALLPRSYRAASAIGAGAAMNIISQK